MSDGYNSESGVSTGHSSVFNSPRSNSFMVNYFKIIFI